MAPDVVLPDAVVRAEVSPTARAALLEMWRLAKDGVYLGSATTLAKALGRSKRHAQRVLAELKDAAMVFPPASTRDGWRLVDPAAEVGRVLEQNGLGRVVPWDDVERLRRRLGGLKMTMERAQRQRDRALERLDEEKATYRTRLATLLADADHSVDCLNPECERCEAVARRLEAGFQGIDLDAFEVGQRLATVELYEAAASGLARALRAGHTPGVAHRRRAALTAILAIHDGDHETAQRAIKALEEV